MRQLSSLYLYVIIVHAAAGWCCCSCSCPCTERKATRTSSCESERQADNDVQQRQIAGHASEAEKLSRANSLHKQNAPVKHSETPNWVGEWSTENEKRNKWTKPVRETMVSGFGSMGFLWSAVATVKFLPTRANERRGVWVREWLIQQCHAWTAISCMPGCRNRVC